MTSDPPATRPRESRLAGWLSVALAWLAAASFPLLHGFPRGTDWSLELVRLAEWRQALVEGQVPPAWAPDLYGGFGSPVFLFYPPLAKALEAGLSMLLPSLQAAAVAASLAALLAAALGAAAMGSAALEDAGTAGAPRIAALVLVLQPYVLADLLVRNAQAELLALALLPLALAGLLRADRKPRQAALWLALAVALVTLTHPLTALMLMVILLAGGAFLLRRPAGWAALAAGMGLGLLLSAWSWLPALVLGSWIRQGELLKDRLDFHRNFLPPSQLAGHGHPFSAGWLAPVALLCLLGALLTGRLSGSRRRAALAVLAGGAALLALQLPASRPVWEIVPWMPLLQFPWRLMGPLAVLSALAAALAFRAFTGSLSPRARRMLEAGVLVLALLDALPVFQAARPLPREVRDVLDQNLTPAAVRAFGHRGTVFDEYLPVDADPALWRAGYPGPVLAVPAGVRYQVLRDAGTSAEVDVESPAATGVLFARWFFPGWTATVDGAEVGAAQGPGGVLAVPIPAGRHRVAVRYRQPEIRRAAGWLALLGLTGCVWLALKGRRGGRTFGS
jgi:6-pyruvoyl-tetrahydropterin synthase-like protein